VFLKKAARRIAAKTAGHRLIGSVKSPIHFVEDFAEIYEIVIFPAQESRHQEMGEFDGAFLSIRDHKDDINLREQPAEQLHPQKLFSVCR
jgi:hypothetical protein